MASMAASSTAVSAGTASKTRRKATSSPSLGSRRAISWCSSQSTCTTRPRSVVRAFTGTGEGGEQCFQGALGQARVGAHEGDEVGVPHGVEEGGDGGRLPLAPGLL